jgi:hypothetical protein
MKIFTHSAPPFPAAITAGHIDPRKRVFCSTKKGLRRESAEAKSERIIVADLKRLNWSEWDLDQQPKGEPPELELAAGCGAIRNDRPHIEPRCQIFGLSRARQRSIRARSSPRRNP